MVGLEPGDRCVNTFILTLMELPGVGARTVQKILEDKRLIVESTEVLDGEFALALNVGAVNKALAYDPIDSPDANAERADAIWMEAEGVADMIVERANDCGASILNPYMSAYPRRLLLNKRYPPILFCRGDAAVLNAEKAVAIIGTREPTDFGKRMGTRLAEVLAADEYVIVSGLALGCDTVGHEGALLAEGKTIAVLPTPIDAPVYPSQNQGLADRIVGGGGALVSEYAPGVMLHDKQLLSNLVARDEWQPGLSDGVIAIETSVAGGTNHAMKHAQGTNTPIAVFDYSSRMGEDFYADERFGGNVKYLKDGAFPIFEASTIEDFKIAMESYRQRNFRGASGGTALGRDSQLNLFG